MTNKIDNTLPSKADHLRAFQTSMLGVVKSYSDMGISYDDLMTLILNIGAILAVTAHRSLDHTQSILAQVYDLVVKETPPLSLN